ncbi:MAG: uroporphyrinogen decarboxylase family protein [Planctomycetota bacterium]
MNNNWRVTRLLDPTVRDRIMAAMNFEEGDRVPIWDYLDNRGIFEHFNPPDADYHAGMVKVYHALGIDLCRGYGASFKEEQDGTVTEQGSQEITISGRTRWVSKKAIRSLDDLRAWNGRPATAEQIRESWLKSTTAQQDRFGPHTMYVPGHGCGFHGTYGTMGLELFSYAIHDARDAVEKLMNVLNTNSVRTATVAAEKRLCPMFFVGDDIAYKGALMFSPAFLRETFIPCLARVCEPLVNAGIKVIFHSDGYVMEILDDMIEAGISGLNPVEPIAGMDIGLLKKRYGRNLILVGNVDCSQVLPLGTREEVVEATKACIRAASPGGGHFIGSSSEITPSTPVENILAFYATCRDFGAYPIRS